MYTLTTKNRLSAWRKYPYRDFPHNERPLPPRWFASVSPAVPSRDERGTLWYYGEGIGGDIERSRPGLRFVGYADKVYSEHIRHSGWHGDPDGEGFNTMRGVVFQLPGKNGAPRYVAGYEWGESSGRSFDAGVGVIFMDEIFTDEDRGSYTACGKRSAAIMADEHARAAAEAEREYQQAER